VREDEAGSYLVQGARIHNTRALGRRGEWFFGNDTVKPAVEREMETEPGS
jgi:hypothetical protein